MCGADAKDTYTCICERCKPKFPFIKGNVCLSCGLPVPSESKYCLACKTGKNNFSYARASFLYDDTTSHMIYVLKYSGAQYMAKFLARFMADTYTTSGMNADVIVCVPVSEARLKNRGYNQSELIAAELSRIINVKTDFDVIYKIRGTEHQTGLTRKEREANLRGSFDINKTDNYKGKNILLIDDVYTTGFTVNECSKMLQKLKPSKIFVLTAAKTDLKFTTKNN